MTRSNLTAVSIVTCAALIIAKVNHTAFSIVTLGALIIVKVILHLFP